MAKLADVFKKNVIILCIDRCTDFRVEACGPDGGSARAQEARRSGCPGCIPYAVFHYAGK